MATHPQVWKTFFGFMICLLLVSVASALEFRVGGERGWRKPTGEETESYNQWTARNRFHIGDSLYFKYKNDSVLVVDHNDYISCNITNPVLQFDDGSTTFTFNRYGFFYIISGKPQHCKSGQKLVVRVMVHPEIVSPGPAPAPLTSGGQGSGGDGSGSSPSRGPMSNSSLRISSGSSLIMAVLVSVLVLLFFV